MSIRLRISRCPALTGLLVTALTLFGAATGLAALDLPPEKGGSTYELGMPPIWKGFAALEWQFARPSDIGRMAGFFNYEIRRDLGSPVVGIAALAASGYVGYGGDEWQTGVRGLFRVPSFHFGIGADYGFEIKQTDLLFQLDLPLRRGGIFGRGTTLTASWLPTRDHTFALGVTSPLWGRNIGQTRPKSDNVKLDPRKPKRQSYAVVHPELDDVLTGLAERIRWVAHLTQPFVEHGGADPREAMAEPVKVIQDHINTVRDAFPGGMTAGAEIQAYHATLDLAFSLAADSTATGITETGRRYCAKARDLLLEDVLIPYNRTLGQRKKTDTLLGMIAVAQTEFASWVLTANEQERSHQRKIFLVFQTLCDNVEETRAWLKDRWDDNRFVWLPLQIALRPDQHDTQDELDALIERAVGQPFTTDNQLWYVLNEQFQWEMARSVQAAEDYHVLWIHDFRGRDGDGDPDEMAFVHTVNYLRALTRRVEAYDDRAKLPVYMILLDQHYFEINKSRLWLRLLREPLHYEIGLPKEFAEWEEILHEEQRKLREAVDGSVLLTVARSQYGEKWLKNLVKVHVNITNPADPSFFSWHVMGIIPVPDNMMRDHRKIAFYDVTEEDPYRGMAMFTGMGIGSHYTGASWEDRAIMIQGPGALEVKNAARGLLEAQGFDPEQIPYPLRAKPTPRDYPDALAANRQAVVPDWLGEPGRVMQLHSETGYHDKPINVAKAIQYSMMPAGSVLKVPDSLWQSYLYGSLLAGSALRGCRVMVIAPTSETAPSNAPPTLARAHGLMGRLIVFSNMLAREMDDQGGLLKVGLYNPRQSIGDIAGRMLQSVDNSEPWMEKIYPEAPELQAAAAGAQAQLDSMGYEIRYLTETAEDEKPKLHLKAQFMASGPAWERLMSRPELGGILRLYIQYLADNQRGMDEGGEAPDVKRFPEEMAERWGTLFRNLLADLEEGEREQLIYYFSVGSTNMDYRSMVMDGEVQIFISGWQGLLGLMDFILLPGLADWVESPEELDALLTPPGGFTRGMAGFMKLSL